jgi:hypothetical protein
MQRILLLRDIAGVDRYLVNDVSGQTTGPIFKGIVVSEESSLHFFVLKDGPTGCPETSVTNYQSTLCNNSEERRSVLRVGGRLKIKHRRFNLKCDAISLARLHRRFRGTRCSSQNQGTVMTYVTETTRRKTSAFTFTVTEI